MNFVNRFVLEQWLHYFPEVYEIRQSPHIMMALDGRGVAKSAFDDIRVYSALHKIVYRADFLGHILEHTNEFLTDELALAFRLCHAFQFLVEPFLGVHADEVQLIRAIRAEHGLDLIPLILAQQAVVHEYAGQLLADGL